MTLAEITSSSNPTITYKLVQAKDGGIYCTCPSWRFSGKNGKPRTCKHLTTDAIFAVASAMLTNPQSETDVDNAIALLAAG